MARKPVVWLSILAVFITSVTIAAIQVPTAPRRFDTPDIAGLPGALSITPPQQTVVFGEKQTGEIRPTHRVPDHQGARLIGVSSLESPGNSGTTVKPFFNQHHHVGSNWKVIKIAPGDTLLQLLKQHSRPSPDLLRTINTHPQAKALYQLVPGNRIRLRLGADKSTEELVYHIDANQTVHVSLWPDGFHVSTETRQLETRLAYVTGVIESTLFEDGQTAGLSDALIMKLVEIFGWDIDFALDLRAGDSFSVIYAEKYWLGQKIADGPILAAEFYSQKNSKQPIRAIAFRNDKGFTAYYKPSGLSMRRQFLRTPVEFSRISSRYSNGRYHPILKRWRAHKGVDYAAQTGTPIRATARGRILFKGWKGGYGNTVVIRHGGQYSTLYGHLSRFNRLIRPGSWVEQGQIIGYVGKTGLATGPHLHYEFQVHGVHRNPLTFKFPGATKISQENREEYLHDARNWSAKLDLIGRNSVANSDRRTTANR